MAATPTPTTPMVVLSPGSATPTPGSERQKFLWQRPKLSGRNSSRHKVSFSTSSKGSKGSGRESGRETELSSHSDSSRPSSPAPKVPLNSWATPTESDDQQWQKVDRTNEVTWLDSMPTPLPSPPLRARPFLVYLASFLPILGESPTLQLLAHDTRGPYFQHGGIFTSRSNTLFLTSAPIHDPSPSKAPSRNQVITVSRIDFFSPTDITRDKVRTGDHQFMPRNGCSFNTGLVLCAQGTLSETAGLIFMEAKRPHKTQPLLTNFNGVPLNSPHSCITHSDGSLWFSDPHLPHSPSFRPKPQLPPLIYRFDPATSDIRAMTNDIACPTAIAFSPSYRTLYVIDGTASLPSKAPQNGDAAPAYTTRNIIYAFTVSQPPTVFLTNKRLFAMPGSNPISLVTDLNGNVYCACADGVHVFNEGGSLIGRIAVEGGVTGLCFGRGGELWAFGGEKLWRVHLSDKVRGAAGKL